MYIYFTAVLIVSVCKEAVLFRPSTLLTLYCSVSLDNPLCQASIYTSTHPTLKQCCCWWVQSVSGIPMLRDTLPTFSESVANSWPHVSIVERCGDTDRSCSVSHGSLDWGGFQPQRFLTQFTPLQTHCRNSAGTDTHSDNLRGLDVQQMHSRALPPALHTSYERADDWGACSHNREGTLVPQPRKPVCGRLTILPGQFVELWEEAFWRLLLTT